MAWFRRKSKSQRVGQRNVLDVKLSADQTHRLRTRAAFKAVSVLAAVLFTIYICWRGGEWLLRVLVYENRAYAIRTLDIQTDGVLAPEQIRRWAGAKLGDNLFLLDLARIKRDLELSPVIQSVAVERSLPNILRIRVVEREPVAQIVTAALRVGEASQNVTYLLDAEGHVMLPLELRQRAIPPTAGEQYPSITGANLAEVSPGRQVESAQIRAAMRLILAFERSPLAGWVELKSIDVSAPSVLQITTDQRSEVFLRDGDLERQLHRWRLLYDLGAARGQQIGSLDLSVGENIPLRWLEAGSVQPPGPKKNKNQLYRKKHA